MLLLTGRGTSSEAGQDLACAGGADRSRLVAARRLAAEEDHDFASQPQQFRVKGLLGLPQLKMHANTGTAQLTLPPLEHQPAVSTVSTPAEQQVKQKAAALD